MIFLSWWYIVMALITAVMAYLVVRHSFYNEDSFLMQLYYVALGFFFGVIWFVSLPIGLVAFVIHLWRGR